ncbi:MAG: DUF3363 domain-containing protein [Nitrospirales bacterium]|nr:DUF3363 domain-containing protein [Nitrospirales bacterium]
MPKHQSTDFTPRISRRQPRDPSSQSVFARLAKGIANSKQTTRQTGPKTGGKRKTWVARAQAVRSRRVVVKVRVVKTPTGQQTGGAYAHLHYITREGIEQEQEQDKGALFDQEQGHVEVKDFFKTMSKDPHHFRFIVSPEDGHELDLTTFTKDLMATVQKDVGRDLEWVAVNHYNTDNPHTHIVVRGLDAHGQELRIPKDYISHGIRDRAKDIATRELGLRTDLEIRETHHQEISKERYTSLDRTIKTMAQGRVVTSGPYPSDPEARHRYGCVVDRMKTMTTMGLADSIGQGQWELRENWDKDLMAMGERGDIIKTMHKELATGIQGIQIFQKRDPQLHTEGRVVKTGFWNELYDNKYIVIESLGGHAAYIKGYTNDFEGMNVGAFVSAHTMKDPWLRPADHTIEAQAKDNGSIYDARKHLEDLTQDKTFEAKRQISSEEYVDAHITRAARLVRMGYLEEVGPSQWRVAKNLTHALAQKDIDEPKPPRLNTQVLDSRSLDDQIQARGPTWLDRHHQFGDHQVGPLGKEGSAAKTQRKDFLRMHGFDPATRDLQAALSRWERNEWANAYEKQHGVHYHSLEPGQTQTAMLKGKATLPSGSPLAVLQTERSFAMVPWRHHMEPLKGQQVTVGMTMNGTPFVRPMARQISKGFER